MSTQLPAREVRIRRALDHLRQETTDQCESMRAFTPDGYTDRDVAAQERERIFGRVPTIVGHSSEVRRPNDFLTVQLSRNNVLVVRQRDGSVKAFVNACRHRGAMLEEAEKGRCRLFSCGYHRWSYDTDGTLRAVTRDTTFGDIDKSQYGLIELPCEERHGLIWVVDRTGETIDVSQWLGGPMDEVLSEYELDTHECIRSESFDEPANWKIMVDAFLDAYHIQYAHPNTAAKHVHTNVLAAEDFGPHSQFLAPRKTIDRYIEEDPGNQRLSQHVTDSHLLFPNTLLLRQPDHFQLLTFRPHPEDPSRTRMEMRLVVPSLANSGMDEVAWNKLWDKNWRILLAVLREEDLPLLRGIQRAMSSQDAGSLILGRNEVVNQQFHREISRMLA
jgi:phenylpropionate dioxygenase-like ring-hydroxylating dioxygenase large terminal subunit